MVIKTKVKLATLGLALMLLLLWALIGRTQTTPAAVLGTISGRVTRDGGQPAVGFTVSAYPAMRPFLHYVKDNPNTAVTDADGRYTITLTLLSYLGREDFREAVAGHMLSDDASQRRVRLVLDRIRQMVLPCSALS